MKVSDQAILTRVSDGKPSKSLISGSRLRLYTASKRAHFYAKYPASVGDELIQMSLNSRVNSLAVSYEFELTHLKECEF